MEEAPVTAGGGDPPNLRRFLLFRVLFNGRFYYPVYAILFLDFGLTLREFAWLNAAWAVTIVLLEVPSGALADQFGRRTLVVAASVLMVLEMIVLCLTPVGAGSIVFWMFLLNRVLSGAAEAAASGADEALAYDSLPEDDREALWSRATARLIKWQSIGFIAATVTGAIVYDPERMTSVAQAFGFSGVLEQSTTVKFPIYLNLLAALATLVVALGFREAGRARSTLPFFARVRASFAGTVRTGRWVLGTPAPFLLILIAVLFDSVVRLFYTIGSQYYRLLGIDTEFYGWIGAVGSLIGIAAAALVEPMVSRLKPATNFRITALLIVAGLASLAFPIPIWGVLLVIPLWFAMRFLHYFLSQYLNRVADSSHRATALSFKGLAINLWYGLVTLLYGVQTAAISHHRFGRPEETLDETQRRQVFADAIEWWAVYFAATLVALAVYVRLRHPEGLDRLIAEAAARARGTLTRPDSGKP